MNLQIFEKIEIIQGDITKLGTDAIVNAANSSLLGGGGVDGAIHLAAGPKLLAECKTLGGCQTGEAKITNGYHLKARYVIHTVGPIYRGLPQDAALLKNCYQNSLLLAISHSIHTIAFPAISCGVYGYPIKDACQIAIDTVAAFIEKHESIEKVVFVLFSSKDKETYVNYFTKKRTA